MKKLAVLLSVFLLFVSVSVVKADKPTAVNSNGVETAWSNSGCADIQSGKIMDSKGNVLTMGFDQYGYNYQAHLFNGYAGNYSRPTVPVTEGDTLVMKWSDSWLANVDCNNDGKLDRGLVDGVVGGISRGWETNHYVGSYVDNGEVQHYTDFIKIVWTGPGSPLWGQYSILEEVWNDSGAGYHGLSYKDGVPGFGLNDQWTSLPTP